MAIRKGEKKEDTKVEGGDHLEDEDQKMNKNELMGIPARNRMNTWAANTVDDAQMLTKLRKGLVTHHSVHTHEFRDRNQTAEKSGVPFMPRK